MSLATAQDLGRGPEGSRFGARPAAVPEASWLAREPAIRWNGAVFTDDSVQVVGHTEVKP